MEPAMVVRKYQAKSEGKAMELMAADTSLGSSYLMEHHTWSGYNLTRSIVTPVILIVAGWLLGSAGLVISDPLVGVILGGVIGIAYLLFVIILSKGTLTVTFRRR